MKLPVEITPNPLLSSRVEIRYVLNIQPDEVVGAFYSQFKDVFPILRETKVSKDPGIADELMKFAPDFLMSNDKYAIAFNGNAISFENMGDYQLWGNYFPFIRTQLSTLIEMKIVRSIQRISVRYVSLFEKQLTKESTFIKIPQFNLEGYKENLNLYRTSFNPSNDPNVLLKVQIVKNARASTANEFRIGTLIDIDACREFSDIDLDDNIFEIVDNLHAEEKRLFFSMLDNAFLQTLNPKYDRI
ncbi:TIGR04255 family protein [Chitinophaga sp. Cy-1792]|uniref:TIGR04255 family protein n=1 Tax=Chitinophaga sp. Cy-1792 TaxID=2608339 RepID=UPI00142079FB|nr:TIGR04255 family protein [Chitinophaga sp. Cy-1792]NIG52510.1 TIGR04255 family protein [Chitinophaga sp. Cy-1792]